MEQLAIFGGKPVRDNKIYYGHQCIDDEDIQAVVDVMRSDYLTCGPQIAKLEKKLCDMTGAKYAVVFSNGTAALHAACNAADVRDGDEVITSPMTFAASANCALYCGAKPVFADIDKHTYNISPATIKQCITSKTKAVVAVDYTGQAVQLDEIMNICKKYGVVCIEDAAHSIGTCYQGKEVGSIADMTTFSFHPVKTVTGGEGGAVLTNSEQYYKKLLLFRSHGITRNADWMMSKEAAPWYYEQISIGYNYRITDMQAALISSQLDKLDFFKRRRRQIVQYYNDQFASMPEVILQKNIEASDTCWHLYVLQLDMQRIRATREELFCALNAENVCCNVHYIPVYYFPYYQELGYEKGLCPNAETLYENMLTIPLYPAMTDEDVKSVVHAVKKVITYYRR